MARRGALLALLIGCLALPSFLAAREPATQDPEAPAAGESSGRESASAAAAVRSLVRARPALWRECAAAVLAIGPSAAPALVHALRTGRYDVGEQPAIAVLGELGGEAAETYLLELLGDRDNRAAAEAALALGRTANRAHVRALREVAENGSRNPHPRAAALAALLDLEAEADDLPLLRTFLLAGTPEGYAAGSAAGLPDRSRWALELEILADAITRRLGDDSHGLDPDLSWPDRVTATERALAALRALPEKAPR